MTKPRKLTQEMRQKVRSEMQRRTGIFSPSGNRKERDAPSKVTLPQLKFLSEDE